MILSHGKNGYGAINANTNAQNPCPPTNCDNDEVSNYDGLDATFLSRTTSSAGSTLGEFDDIVAWLSKNILFNRMVAAGKLP